MLDESMFEDIHEIAENSAYLKAVEDRDVSLEMLEQLPAYDECAHIESRLQADGKLTFDVIFAEATGFYQMKCFLISDYSVDKAIFLKDVEAYRSMRFESARRKVAALLYQRFVSTDETQQQQQQHGGGGSAGGGGGIGGAGQSGQSVFTLIQQSKGQTNDEKTQRALQNLQTNGVPATTNGAASNTNNNTAIAMTNMTTRTHTSTSAVNSARTHNVSGADGHTQSPLNGTVTSTPLSINGAPTNGHTAPAIHPRDLSPVNTGPFGAPSPQSSSAPLTSRFQMGTANNPIGVYGKSIRIVRDRVARGEAPSDLFDDVARDVLTDLRLDAFPRFKQSEFYKRYIRTKWIETHRVTVKDFTTFRVLGRGGFGAVHACRKKNSGQIYAMKCINKKLVKVKSALDNVLEERNVLCMMKSNFVTNLKYALQDEETLYLIMDLMLGGDLKFHLINAGRFTERRARFYAAEVLLGLEAVHRLSIIYRDMKLENVLLDDAGHCRLSDLGLAVVTKVKIKGYAGTPGYTAPEMIKNKLYGVAADIFSYGVMLYRMCCGSKPFKGKVDRDLDKAVIERKPAFPKEIFSKEAISLLTGLLQKRPENRLGCLERGVEEIKSHPFFESIDWGLLEAGYLDPPFVPNKFDVNAASLKDIGDFDRNKYKHVRLDERFRARIKNFEYTSVRALQEEMVSVLEKTDANTNFEKFAQKSRQTAAQQTSAGQQCCVTL